ncbi:hypothetical protein [Photobacterium nomapromontoriensis]|uniref:hypothetical protein n=1 Tax=Photobacterium nomapromontoriensis TaxID=2910237 RepID=UPI003D1343F2
MKAPEDNPEIEVSLGRAFSAGSAGGVARAAVLSEKHIRARIILIFCIMMPPGNLEMMNAYGSITVLCNVISICHLLPDLLPDEGLVCDGGM